ncbi:cache domain-containing protein [Desulfovibrio litoralis]|uniref:Cache domain-containing protein n=1 Tax=Desulfovibrio litoralis DSM 11393 TaxID=1121455 RepID=A0A1M7SRC6_9BACT|nr:cache domain-containing protein [Desulfovibrio litoralis]SHN61103.1 Cache domain-containing protein [Desulfovibrio litoralis DSM 11393]
MPIRKKLFRAFNAIIFLLVLTLSFTLFTLWTVLNKDSVKTPVSTIKNENDQASIISEKTSVKVSNSNNIKDQASAIDPQGQIECIEGMINIYLSNIQSTLKYVASLPELKEGLGKFNDYSKITKDILITRENITPAAQKVFDIFQHLKKSNPVIYLIYAGYKDSSLVEYPGDTLFPGYNPPMRDWYKDAISSESEISFMQPYVSQDHTFVGTMVARIKDKQGEVVGVVGIDFDLSGLLDKLNNILPRDKSYLIVLDQTETVISDFSNPYNAGKTVKDLNNPFLNKIASTKEGFFEHKVENQLFNVNVFTSKSTGWIIAVVEKSSKKNWFAF